MTYLTINGRVVIDRVVYWQSGRGTRIPTDAFLGISSSRYSPGVRELSCREAMGGSFRQAAEDLARVGQLEISAEMVRRIVEEEGRRVLQSQKDRELIPGWTAEDCRERPEDPSCVITGADGVKVPMITEAEKQKRRAHRRQGGKVSSSRRKRGRKRQGSDQAYKEFKLVAFYDPSHQHQYVVGTSGDHRVLGRLMRREAGRLKLDLAEISYSVTDGGLDLSAISNPVTDAPGERSGLLSSSRAFDPGRPDRLWRGIAGRPDLAKVDERVRDREGSGGTPGAYSGTSPVVAVHRQTPGVGCPDPLYRFPAGHAELSGVPGPRV